MSAWSLVYEGFDPAREDLREALCTLGNGYFATRGAAPESSADDVHYPGTYLAGGYNRLTTELAGRQIENEDLVNFPNWLPLTFRMAGADDWFHLRHVELLAYRQELDLRRGVLLRTVRFRDRGGRISQLRQRRLVHMGRPHLAALETVLLAENWAGTIEIRSALDGRVVNDGVRRYRQLENRHLRPLAAEPVDAETICLQVETNQSLLRVAQAARTRLFRNGLRIAAPHEVFSEPGQIAQVFSIAMEPGAALQVEKVVALYSSRDRAISEAKLQACTAVRRAPSFDQLEIAQALAWSHLWRRFDIELESEEARQGDANLPAPLTILRLHLFHLLQTVSLHSIDLDVGVPSRGWHGEAYRGHVFWDELYIFPLLNLRLPEITRALLKYRYRRLEEARTIARDAGFRGALFPWQSGSSGREETQVVHLNPESGRWLPDHTHLQRHVNAAIAYNVWQYYQATQDREFLSFHGAEMILEIARFWASSTTFNEAQQRYEIHGVMGPDEYHDAYPDSAETGLRNNAYTNIMAVWVLATALELLKVLPEDRYLELCETLQLEDGEIAQWRDISHRMRVVFHGDGLISQFEGYDQLAEFDWSSYRLRHGPVMRLDRILEAEGDSPNRYKVSKQADVLMLFYLFSAEELQGLFERLGYPFDHQSIPRTIDYYLARTSHGSTLSHVVHSWVLARADRQRSWQLFTEALQSDIADVQGGTTPEGIHLGAMAGSVDLLQRGYPGVEISGDRLRFNPCLPRELQRLAFRIHYRGQALQVAITTDRLRIRCLHCAAEPIRVMVDEEEFQLKGGQVLEVVPKSRKAAVSPVGV
jgi:alpha,alpha-trehalase